MQMSYNYCCGIREVHNLGADRYEDNPKKALIDILQIRFEEYENSAFILFSEVRTKKSYKYGQQLKKLIEKLNLGKVLSTNSKINPNSKNTIRVYLWEVNQKAVKDYWNLNKSSYECY